MAKVSFVISPEILAAFSAAQDDKSVRSIAVSIENEQFIFKSQQSLSGANVGAGAYLCTTSSSKNASRLEFASDNCSALATDFNQLFFDAELDMTAAAFVLFCEADEENGARRWVLVAWVPDLCRPKDKVPISSLSRAHHLTHALLVTAHSDALCTSADALLLVARQPEARARRVPLCR
jgi:hypothetical protein